MDDRKEECPLCGGAIDPKEKVVVAWDEGKRVPVSMHLGCVLETRRLAAGEKKKLFW